MTIALTAADRLFVNQELSFFNVFNVQTMKPNRAEMGENKMFFAILKGESDFQKPGYISLQMTTKGYSNAAFILSEATYTLKDARSSIITRILQKSIMPTKSPNVKHGRLLEDTSTTPAQHFPADIQFLAVPYLPYFTDCEYYGSYPFIPAIYEAHPRCQLVPEEKVKPINDFDFGNKPVADTCDHILLQCM